MLSAEAHAALAGQIETLTPSAAVLESKGVDQETAATLVRFIKTGAPDVIALKECGLPLETAVSICESISKRHARRAAAMKPVPTPAPKPAPKPVPAAPEPAPKPAADELDSLTALSMLHTVFEMEESDQSACQTKLANDGWSEGTARELAKVINAARGMHRTQRKIR
jgi:hypothetical protein